MIRPERIACVLLGAAIISACAAEPGSEPIGSNLSNAAETSAILTETNPEELIETSVGRTFTIVLTSNASTGYAWVLLSPLNSDKFKLLETRYHPAKIIRAGAPGKESWEFSALNAGETEITLGYRRPWEKDLAPIKVRKYKLRIKPQ